MSNWTGERRMTIVSACTNANGSPELVMTEVMVTMEQVENGIHYYLAEADLIEAGYEEPFVHFDQDEAPVFLLVGLKLHVGLLKNRVTQSAFSET